MEPTTRCRAIKCNKPAIAKGLCGAHYKRLRRHGHIEQTRPGDWGDRATHPLYRTWKGVVRHHRQNIDPSWLDFWKFAADVGTKPDGRAAFCKIEGEGRLEVGNWFWRKGAAETPKSIGHREYMRRRNKSLRDSNPDYFLEKALRRNYGVTLEWYKRKLDEQGGACAICKKPEKLKINGRVVRLSVDHCHDTGRARGLLCNTCNRGIGLLNHDASLLMEALEYLKESRWH